MATKAEMVEFLVQHHDVDPEQFENMNIAQLSSKVKEAKEAIKAFEEAQAVSPIIRPGEGGSGESLRGKIEVGKVDLGNGVSVAVDEVLAYRGRDVHKVSGAHQVTIVNPKTYGPGIVTFEKRPNVWEKEPVAIVRDWRIRAQVLFYPNVRVLNPTLGTQEVSVHARPDYYLPLDLRPDQQMTQKMANYVKGQLGEKDETERLTQAIAADLLS